MKRAVRVLSALLAAVMLLFAVTGCVQRRVPKEVELEYIALEAGLCDCIDGGKHSLEFFAWSTEELNSHQNTTAPLEVSVLFNGVTYTGTYLRSLIRKPNFYNVHRYESTNKAGQTVYFEINVKTGALTSFQVLSMEPERTKLNEEKGRTIADSIADDYLNLADYQVFMSDLNDGGSRRYTYYRKINGIKLADQLTVTLDGNGDVTYFSTTSLGSFNGVDTVVFDEAKAKLAIEDKLDVIYAENERARQYEITTQTLIRLTDGNFAVLYELDIQFDFLEGDIYLSNGYVQLLVIAQPKTDTP